MESFLHNELKNYVTPQTTFEPHISVEGSKYGYKIENIYYFENGQLVEL